MVTDGSKNRGFKNDFFFKSPESCVRLNELLKLAFNTILITVTNVRYNSSYRISTVLFCDVITVASNSSFDSLQFISNLNQLQ